MSYVYKTLIGGNPFVEYMRRYTLYLRNDVVPAELEEVIEKYSIPVVRE